MYEISEHKNSLGRLLMVNASSVKPSNNNQDFFLALLLFADVLRIKSIRMYFPDEKDPFIVCDHFLFVWKSFDLEEDFSCVRWRPWSLFIGLGPSCRGKKRGGLVRGSSGGRGKGSSVSSTHYSLPSIRSLKHSRYSGISEGRLLNVLCCTLCLSFILEKLPTNGKLRGFA